MSQASREYSEKRNFIRMKVNTPIDVTLENNDTSFTGVCRDLSGGGMLIEVDKAMPVGTELKILLASAHGHHPMLKAKTVITRVEADHSGTCVMGLKITEMLS